MSARFKSSLVDSGSSFGWLLFDLKSKCLVSSLCDYADDMVLGAQLGRLTVDQEMGYLRVFWAYLSTYGLAVEQVDDQLLERFRDDSLALTKRGIAHRGSEEAAKLTTNAKLIRIYDWLRWLQDTGRVRSGLIGADKCQVTSTLRASAVLNSAKTDEAERAGRYPLIFRLKAGASKHRLGKFVPTEKTVDAVHEYFHANLSSAYAAHRNCLIASVASYTGFRRASIQSLTTSQFTGDNFVRTDKDSVILQPSRQKFAYGDVFEIPGWLHDQVVDFINSHRRDLLQRTGVTPSTHADRVFLSQRTGRPLDDRTFTTLMSRALRALGAGKGSAMHVWRSKFAVEETVEIYETRKELKLDTGTQTMDAAVARRLGHRNSLSARPYTSTYEAAEVARARAARSNDRQKDKRRIEELEEEIRRLKGGGQQSN